MLNSYALFDEVPSVEDYRHLRVLAGLSPKSVAAAGAGLPNTLFAVVVRYEGRLVGMGRLVGDGGLFFQVVDVAVEPGHQRRGLGKAIVGRLVEHIRQIAHPGAYVSLIADQNAPYLYSQFGFLPTAPSVGMALRV